MTITVQLCIRTSHGISPVHILAIPSTPTGLQCTMPIPATVLSTHDPAVDASRPVTFVEECQLDLLLISDNYETSGAPMIDGIELSEYEQELIQKLRHGTDNEEQPEYDDWTE